MTITRPRAGRRRRTRGRPRPRILRGSARPRTRGRAAAARRGGNFQVGRLLDGTGSRQRASSSCCARVIPRGVPTSTRSGRDASIKSPRENRPSCARLADRRTRADGSDAQHGTWRHGVQLDAAARYVFLVNDARLEATVDHGERHREHNNMHYFRNTSTLKDGDLVLMDSLPTIATTSATRTRLARNGKYNPVQRECCSSCSNSKAFSRAFGRRDRPADPRRGEEGDGTGLRADAFSKPIYEKAARTSSRAAAARFLATVGRPSNDVGGYRNGPLKPDRSSRWTRRCGARRESTCATRTRSSSRDGVENFTHFLPMELNDMEKLVLERRCAKGAAIPASAISTISASVSVHWPWWISASPCR